MNIEMQKIMKATAEAFQSGHLNGVQNERQRVLKIIENEVPTSWLHHLLEPLLLTNTTKNTRAIEDLLRNIKNKLKSCVNDAIGETESKNE